MIADLSSDPYPPTAEELRDHDTSIYKIKVDGWRIFYKVNEADIVVIMIAVKRRTPNTYTNIFE